MTTRRVRYWLGATVAGLSVLDIAVAVLLSVYAVLLVSHQHGGAGAAIAVLGLTLPVALRRRMPVAAAGILAAAALVNTLVFGPMVRCGPALPAIFLVAYSVAARRGRPWSAAGLLLCAAAMVAEGLADPQIGPGGLAFVLPLLAIFFAAGCLVRARTEAAGALRAKSAELRRQREQTARLAVLADRAQVTADLERTLQSQIGGLASAATTGLTTLDGDPQAAHQALASIERGGRDVLGQMRELLSTLHEPTPSEPQPTLERLPGLLSSATTAAARLTVEGSPRTLPAGLELSGYRIVEHLLLALDDAPEAAIDVTLRFCADGVELDVCGPPSPGADLRAALAAARERAALHGGTVKSRLDGGRCYATARLPLISGYA
jgi:signal transduction histidine kinase